MDYFRSHQRMFNHEDGLHIFDGRNLTSIEGSSTAREVLETVAANLDGRAALDDLVAATGLDRATLECAVTSLRTLGLISDEPAAVDDGPLTVAANFAASFRPGTQTVTAAIRTARRRRIFVTGDAAVSLSGLLSEDGFDVCPASTADLRTLPVADTLLVATPEPDGSSPELLGINAIAVERGLSWLPVCGFDGWSTLVGPLIIPNETACLQCLMARRAANTGFTSLARSLYLELPGAPQPASMLHWTHSVAAQLAGRWALDSDLDVVGRVFVLVAYDLSMRSARVFRVPRCRGCHSDDWVPAAAPWDAASS